MSLNPFRNAIRISFGPSKDNDRFIIAATQEFEQQIVLLEDIDGENSVVHCFRGGFSCSHIDRNRVTQSPVSDFTDSFIYRGGE